MSADYVKYEADGWFYLSRQSNYCTQSDDIGRGGMSITRFQSEEGREYFIQAENARAAQAEAVTRLEWLVDGLRKAVKRRDVRKRVLDLIGGAE